MDRNRRVQNWLQGAFRAFAAQDTLAPPITPPPQPSASDSSPAQPSALSPQPLAPRWPPPQGLAQAAWIIARREMADVISDWRILAPALMVVVVFPLLVVIMTAQSGPFLT